RRLSLRIRPRAGRARAPGAITRGMRGAATTAGARLPAAMHMGVNTARSRCSANCSISINFFFTRSCRYMKRIGLFLLTNLGVLITLSVVSSLLGFNRYLDAQGVNFGALLGFAAVFGFGGAFISLLISKWSAKRSVGAKVITQPVTEQQRWLFETVQRQATLAGIKMPEVAIYPSPEVNAFATGASRNNALVAVSEGLLQRMTRDEAEAVIGHEISHVANGDMVTLTLIQGVLNTFVIFIAR